MSRRIGIFLDRDGTINEEVDYLRTPEELRLLPGAAEAIREANENCWVTVLVTNQSGIARGYITEDGLEQIHSRLHSLLSSQQAFIDAIYYCPHHPSIGNGAYRAVCACRKPQPGMLQQAAQKLDLDLSRSFIIGDRMIDIQTGINAGTGTILVLTGYGKEELALCRQHNVPIDHVADNLFEAIQFIKQLVKQKTV